MIELFTLINFCSDRVLSFSRYRHAQNLCINVKCLSGARPKVYTKLTLTNPKLGLFFGLFRKFPVDSVTSVDRYDCPVVRNQRELFKQ